MVVEKTLESPLDFKEIKPVNPKENEPWIFIGRTDVEALILWPPDAKSWLIWKDPETGKDSGQEEKGTKEDKMVGWHHWFNGYESRQTPGDREGQGSLACCSPWAAKSQIQLSNWTMTVTIFTSIPDVNYGCIFLKTNDSKVELCIIYNRYWHFLQQSSPGWKMWLMPKPIKIVHSSSYSD